MPVYRCYVCTNDKGLPGRDFTATPVGGGKLPAYPECGTGEEARDQGLLAVVETIHFDSPKNVRRGVGHAACNAALKVGCGHAFTGVPSAVTCPACRASAAFATAAAAHGEPVVPADVDFEVTLDPRTGVTA